MITAGKCTGSTEQTKHTACSGYIPPLPPRARDGFPP